MLGPLERAEAVLGPLERAEAVFARARRRRLGCIGPAEVRSPMDIDPTVTVPRSVILACEPRPATATT